MYLIDTNVLLSYPSVLDNFENIIIHIRVVEELDRLKNNINSEIAYNARRATHALKSHDVEYVLDRDNKLSVDDDLIKVAKKYKYVLITNDLNMQIKANARKVECLPFSKVESDYNGVRYLKLPFDDNLYDSRLESMIDTGKPPFEMKENEYLIVKNANSTIELEDGSTDYEDYCSFVFKNGKLKLLNGTYRIKNDYVGEIVPKNLEQECLMDTLYDKNTTIILALGMYGTGKSFIVTNFALQQLDKGKIDKIVYVPNNSATENTRELGYLPGTITDKELIYMGPIIDLVGEIRARDMVEKGLIEIVPLSVMRGRSFSNSIIIVNEAQNLTEEHAKLLVARCAHGTQIIFDGDIKQTDNQTFKNKNGLKILLRLKESPIFSKITGIVKLKKIERSLTAQASAYLDNFTS